MPFKGMAQWPRPSARNHFLKSTLHPDNQSALDLWLEDSLMKSHPSWYSWLSEAPTQNSGALGIKPSKGVKRLSLVPLPFSSAYLSVMSVYTAHIIKQYPVNSICISRPGHKLQVMPTFLQGFLLCSQLFKNSHRSLNNRLQDSSYPTGFLYFLYCYAHLILSSFKTKLNYL